MKSRTKPALRVVPAVQVQLSLNVQGVLRDVQQAFYGLCVNAGKQVLAAMMEVDRVALCGAKNVPHAARKAVRVKALIAPTATGAVDDQDGFTTKHLFHAHCSRRLAGQAVRGLRKT